MKWHPHYLRFTPNPDCNHNWRRTFSLGKASRCSPPSPWPVPRLRDPGIGASAKPGHQTTPARHNMTSTVENCTMRKGCFSPQTKQQKQGGSRQEKQTRTFFQWLFIALAAKKCAPFTSWLQTVNWRIDGKTGFLEACSYMMWRSLIASKSPQSLRWKSIASCVYPVSDLIILYSVYMWCLSDAY